MKRPALLVVVIPSLIAAGLVLAACGGDQSAGGAPGDLAVTSSPSDTSPSPAATTSEATSSSPAPDEGLVVRTASSDFGTMLFDSAGQAIYLFDREATRRPRCYGACATAWPPVLTRGSPQGAGAVRTGLLGTVERADGSTQVTYAGHPLYYYAHEGPNQVLCHDVVEFGGRWLVVTPDGSPAA